MEFWCSLIFKIPSKYSPDTTGWGLYKELSQRSFNGHKSSLLQLSDGTQTSEYYEGVASNQSSSFQGGLCASLLRGFFFVSLSAGPESCASDGRSWIERTGSAHVFARFFLFSPSSIPLRLVSDAGCNPSPRQEHTSDGQTMDSLGSRCKIVVVGDTQCGKTALLHVFAKDCYPEVGLSKVSTWVSFFPPFF